MLDNQKEESGYPGHIEAAQEMVASGELKDFLRVSWKTVLDRGALGVRHLLDAIESFKPDVTLVLAPKQFPAFVGDFELISTMLRSSLVGYWEGDAFGRRKRVSPQMSWWAKRADVVFTVAGEPQVNLLFNAGAALVHQTLHTYDHVLYREQERGYRGAWDLSVAFCGNNLARIPGITGLPGSMGRLELVLRLKLHYGSDFGLFGANWPHTFSRGPTPFKELASTIQSAKVLANWDHFPETTDYASDRLPVALISGRPQVTTRHPGMAWAPSEQEGHFQETSPRLVVERVRELTSAPHKQIERLGIAAHQWAKHRVSHREAIRHMLSLLDSAVRRPPGDPWDNLPGPWRQNSAHETCP